MARQHVSVVRSTSQFELGLSVRVHVQKQLAPLIVCNIEKIRASVFNHSRETVRAAVGNSHAPVRQKRRQ
jgi:hypothetical protein